METLVSLCKRRGFVFQSSEIYGGLQGAWDYGPLGVEMANNIKRAWWRSMVQERDDIVGLDAAILMHPDVWRASGHVETFTDPMVDCRTARAAFEPTAGLRCLPELRRARAVHRTPMFNHVRTFVGPSGARLQPYTCALTQGIFNPRTLNSMRRKCVHVAQSASRSARDAPQLHLRARARADGDEYFCYPEDSIASTPVDRAAPGTTLPKTACVRAHEEEEPRLSPGTSDFSAYSRSAGRARGRGASHDYGLTQHAKHGGKHSRTSR
jgi:hypothetical protein